MTPDEVRRAGLEVAYEVESIARALLALANAAADGGAPIDEHLTRCFALRLCALAGVGMHISDFGDRTPTGKQMAHVVLEVYGELRRADDAVAE